MGLHLSLPKQSVYPQSWPKPSRLQDQMSKDFTFSRWRDTAGILEDHAEPDIISKLIFSSISAEHGAAVRTHLIL